MGEGLGGHSVHVKPHSNTENDLASTLQEFVKIIAQQGKAIGELTNAVRELKTQKAKPNVPNINSKPRVTPRYTEVGQPICLRCEGVGHMVRQCPVRGTQSPTSTTTAPAVQGNKGPRLL